jgi:UDP-N-acetylglucosamine 2-epimerase (hydrolysing)
MKPLMLAVQNETKNECMVFVTGMHTLGRYGFTADEVINKSGIKNYHIHYNQFVGEPMDLILANTINGLSRFAREYKPNMIVVHGDRVETLAGAIVGALENILVAHVEGGEVSGTIDESMRHAVSKLANLHFVSNRQAKNRLVKMGEDSKNIFVIGSPDIDVMLGLLPSLDAAKRRYGIKFRNYAIAILNPDTINPVKPWHFFNTLIDYKINYIVIMPNNDTGSDEIFTVLESHKSYPCFKTFSSIRFEYFLTLLKNAQFIIGNSSVGVREAPIYGVPCINVGTRQKNRNKDKFIINIGIEMKQMQRVIKEALKMKRRPKMFFGNGHSVEMFVKIISNDKIFNTSTQKVFHD